MSNVSAESTQASVTTERAADIKQRPTHRIPSWPPPTPGALYLSYAPWIGGGNAPRALTERPPPLPTRRPVAADAVVAAGAASSGEADRGPGTAREQSIGGAV